MKYCNCGCGEEANYGGWVKSHWNRGRPAWNRGKPMPEDQKIKMIKKISEKLKGINHPLFNKHHSKETKEKIRRSLIGTRASNETKNKMSLKRKMENNPNWQGGKSFEPYGMDFNKELRELIRKRDNYCCRLCGEKQVTKKHAVHHIDYNKENNDPINLITLCHICHMKTNHNRQKWTKFFNKLVNTNIKLIIGGGNG